MLLFALLQTLFALVFSPKYKEYKKDMDKNPNSNRISPKRVGGKPILVQTMHYELSCFPILHPVLHYVDA